MKNIIIIGAGIAGLEVAALLSQHAKVKVYEKSKNIGGRARVVEKDGFLLDFGGHPVRYGPDSAIGKTMSEIGYPVEFIKPGDVIGLLKDGTQDIFPSGGLKAIIKTKMIPKFKTLKMLMKFLRYKESQIEELLDVPLIQFIKEKKMGSKIERFLKMTCSALMVCPYIERVSTGELIENIQEVLKRGSVEYPRGGWNSFFNPLQKKILEMGGEINLDNEVQEIIVENGKAIGVKVNNELIKADIVVNTVPVQILFDTILNPELTTSEFVDKCKNLRYTTGIAIDLALSKPITDIDGIMMLEDPPGFGFVPSNLSTEIVPAGKSLMTFFIPLNIEDMKSKESCEHYHKKLKDSIKKHFPNIESVLEFERTLFFNMVDGAECAYDQHRLIRPGNIVPNVENLYLTGDSAGGHGSGGDIGHTSVRDCFKLIKQKI